MASSASVGVLVRRALGAAAVLEAEVGVAHCADYTCHNSTRGRGLSGQHLLDFWVGVGVAGVVGVVGCIADAAVVRTSSACHLRARRVLAGWAERAGSVNKSVTVHAGAAGGIGAVRGIAGRAAGATSAAAEALTLSSSGVLAGCAGSA